MSESVQAGGKKIRLIKTHLSEAWKSQLAKMNLKEGRVEILERGAFQTAEDFLQFLEENKDHKLWLEEIPYEWVQELGWSWSQTARALHCFDELEWIGNRWNARLKFPEAMREALVEGSETFDLSQPSYLVGHGERMRISAYVLSLIGFRKLFCISLDQEQLGNDIQILKRFLFGVHMKVVDPQTLTQQTENGPLVINTYAGENKMELSQDMAYFNYMAPNGLVLDFEPHFDQSYFIEEAKKADMRLLSPEAIIQIYLKNMTRV